MRLFIGIFLPKEILDYLYELQNKLKKELLGKINWANKSKIHLTLKFLGEINEDKVNEIKESDPARSDEKNVEKIRNRQGNWMYHKSSILSHINLEWKVAIKTENNNNAIKMNKVKPTNLVFLTTTNLTAIKHAKKDKIIWTFPTSKDKPSYKPYIDPP